MAFERERFRRLGGRERKCRLYFLWQGWNHSVGHMSWVIDLFFSLSSGFQWIYLTQAPHRVNWAGFQTLRKKGWVPTFKEGEPLAVLNIGKIQFMLKFYPTSGNWASEALSPPGHFRLYKSLSPFICAASPLASFLRTDAYWLPVCLNISLKHTVSMK